MRLTLHRRQFLAQLAGAGATLAAVPAPAANPKKIIRTTHTYKKIGKLQLKADVIRPDDDRVRPVLLWIHGGALIMGGRGGVDRRLKDAVLKAGFAVVSIDYRLAPETKLPEIIRDVEDAYTWLHKNGPKLLKVDTRRIAVAGGSAGGYLTLTAGFRAKPRPAVLVSLWGYGDLVGPWYSQPSKHYRRRPLVAKADVWSLVDGKPVFDSSINRQQRSKFYLYCRQTGQWPQLVSGFDPRKESKKFTPYEPVRNVNKNYPPTILIHGTKDTDVPYEQSTMMAEQFKRHKVPHRLITVQGAGHGLARGKPEEIEAAYEEAVKFIIKHVPGP
ncbi:MAG: alpha/beta hydrolase [Planctomycetes bacterium]|nr:alpha/beta hydrolase [Planctomycetota bacterium]